MDSLERLLAERECERLVSLYAHYVDSGDDRLLDLFAEDAVLDTGQRLQGREAIRASRASRPPLFMRHICSNVVIDVADESHARGRCYLTAYVGPPGTTELGLPAAVGEYSDEFVRTADGWRFASRVFKPALTRRP